MILPTPSPLTSTTLVSALIPPFDSAGLADPPWVFVVLLNTTLALHFLAMGYVFTAALLQIFFSAAARPGSVAEWMLRRTERPLPVALSLTITFGVAPLLFVQALYQPVFYVANNMIAYQWSGVIPVLVLAFYLIYLLQGGTILKHRIPRPFLVLGRLYIFASFAYVLATLTTNALVMLRPDRWRTLQTSGGNPLRLAEPIFAPRLIHNVLAALIIGSVWMIALGMASLRRAQSPLERDGGRGLLRLGAMIGGLAIVIQMMVGVWLIVVERPEVREMLFSVRPAAIFWMASLAFVMGLAVTCVLVLVLEQARALLYVAWACLLIILLGMFSAREAAREVRLASFVRIADWPVHHERPALLLFLGLLLAGFIVVGVALRWVVKGQAALHAAALPHPALQSDD